MNHPFKIIRGGQSESKPAPKEFAKFDTKRAIIDRLKAEIVADRDRYLDKKRSRQ